MARRLLGEILKERGKVTERQVRDALERQLTCDKAIGHILFDMGLVDDNDLSQAWSEQLGCEVVDLAKIEIRRDLLTKIPRNLAEKYNVFPVKTEGGTLTLAMSDPLQDSALSEISALLKLKIKPVVSSALGIAQAIERNY